MWNISITYLNELERADGGEAFQVGVEEGAGGVGGVVGSYAVRLPLGVGGPVGGGEGETVVGSGVYGIHLVKEKLYVIGSGCISEIWELYSVLHKLMWREI